MRKRAFVVCSTCSYQGISDTPSCTYCGSRNTKTATVFDTQAWRLNPGDQIRQDGTNQVMQVQRVRPHETMGGTHVYVDTDQGTTLVRRNDSFVVAPHNSAQQSVPGYGIAGGNFLQNVNTTPAADAKCNACGQHGTLVRSGDHFVCSRCHNTTSMGGAGQHQFGNQTQIIASNLTAVGRRAAALLANEGVSES